MATAAFGHERPYDLLRDGVSTVVPAEVQGGEGAHQWQRVCQSMKVPRGQALLPNAERAVSTGAVSYTHLRAHETGAYL
eukprot:1630267-Pyramimonas_sp.AAC.1